MSNLFALDNIFFRFVNKLLDFVWLLALLTITSLPVITIGAAVCGFYKSYEKCFIKNEGYITQNFIQGFKENFKSITPIWCLTLMLYLILIGDIILTDLLMTGDSRIIFKTIFFILVIVLMGCNCYIFPYVYYFEASLKKVLINICKISLAEFHITVLLVLFLVGGILVSLFIPIVWIIFPATFLIVSKHIVSMTLNKYQAFSEE